MITILLIIGTISLIVGYLLYFKKKKIRSHKIDWIILLLPLVLGVCIIWASSNTISPLDTRFVEYSAIGIRHYPEWSEEIVNVDSLDEIQPVKRYTVTHHEYFALMYYKNEKHTKKGEKEIPKTTFEYYKKLWTESSDTTREEQLITTNKRDFGRILWPKDPSNALIYTKSEPYINYFKNILTIYNFKRVSNREALDLGLFSKDKSDITNSMGITEPRQTLIYGLNVPDSTSRRASYLSTLDHEFRPILIVWVGKDNKEMFINKQRSYWKGGKDNEVVFCVCINDTVRKGILWSGSFSWAENKDFENYVLSTLQEGEKLEVDNYIESCLEGYESGLWRPRNFENYSIAKMPLDQVFFIFSSGVIIILSFILIVRVWRRKEKTNAC